MKKKRILRAITLVLVFAVVFMQVADARVPASEYIASYSVSITADGNNKVTVWFDITSARTMDEIGALDVYIYDKSNDTSPVKTYRYDTTTGMLESNDYFHSGSVTYTGVKGTTYYAKVVLWAGKDGKGDTRYPLTGTVVAK